MPRAPRLLSPDLPQLRRQSRRGSRQVRALQQRGAISRVVVMFLFCFHSYPLIILQDVREHSSEKFLYCRIITFIVLLDATIPSLKLEELTEKIFVALPINNDWFIARF